MPKYNTQLMMMSAENVLFVPFTDIARLVLNHLCLIFRGVDGSSPAFALKFLWFAQTFISS